MALMSRIVILSALAASLAWAADDASADSKAKPSADEHPAATPQSAVHTAVKDFNETAEAAEKKMSALVDFKTEWQKMSPESVLQKCEKDADEQLGKEVAAKKQDFDKLLEKVLKATSVPTEAEVLAVKKSAHAMFEAEQQKVKLVKDLVKAHSRAAKEQSRKFGHEAKEALREVKLAARKVRAARKEAVKHHAQQPQQQQEASDEVERKQDEAERKRDEAERHIERQQEKAEREVEEKEDEAERARDESSDAIEDCFDSVQRKVEEMSDKSHDQAVQRMEEIMHSCAHHISQLKHEQKKADATESSSPSSSKSDSSSKSSSSDSEDKSSSESSSPKSDSSSEALAASNFRAPTVLYSCVGLLVGISAAGLLMSRSGGRRAVGAQPLLLG